MTPGELRRLRNKPQDKSNLAKISNLLIEAFVSKNNLGALKWLKVSEKISQKEKDTY